MGEWSTRCVREEFCDHMAAALESLARASRQLRLASGFAPGSLTRERLQAKRRRVDCLRRRANRIFRRFCCCC